MYQKEITGYKWTNINGANSAQQTVKVAMGVPVNDQAVTTEWVQPMPNYDEEGEILFYFIYWEEDLPPILGPQKTFNINIPSD